MEKTLQDVDIDKARKSQRPDRLKKESTLLLCTARSSISCLQSSTRDSVNVFVAVIEFPAGGSIYSSVGCGDGATVEGVSFKRFGDLSWSIRSSTGAD